LSFRQPEPSWWKVCSPGQTKIDYQPYTKGVKVFRIMYQGKDVLKSGIPTKAGDKIEGVSIVLSQPAPDAKAEMKKTESN